MFSLIFLASALALGVAVVKRIGGHWMSFEAPAMAVALGLIIWSWLSLLCALIAPYNISLALTIGLAGVATWWFWQTSPAWQWQPTRLHPVIWSFLVLATLVIGYLMLTHYLLPANGGLYSANATWGDFGMHSSLISHFAQTNRLSFDFPVAAGTQITYPFMINLLSGWLVYGGWSLHWSILVPSLLLLVAFLLLMISFGLRLFGRATGSAIGLGLTLLCGSAVGIFTAYSDYRASGMPFTEFISHLPKDYTVLSQPNAQLINPVADIILPQRAFVMGFAMFGAILVLLWRLRERPNLKLAAVTGALIGLLPFVHAHTFLALAAVTLSLWVEALIRGQRPFNQWLIAGLAAMAVALPQIAWQSLANGTGTGGHLAPGWAVQPGENLVSFWMHNYGLTGLLIIGVAVTLIAIRPLRRYLVWYAPFLAIFIFANVYSIQPFEFDNNKLIIYVFLMTYLFTGYGIVWLVRRWRLTILPVLAAATLVSASGALAITREFQHSDLFASADDIALAEWAKSSTNPSDVFFTTDRPNQPIANLAGRSIVAGYRGWLYSYHLNYQPRLEAIQTAISGRATLNNPYHAKYVAVSTYEPSEWTVNPSALESNYTLVYSNPSWKVYQIKR